mmetsp:Transcript_7420/g.12544  ORF Transcript_7420/g.12544 Transcript_7420/m.12544 type:complete len:143 (+) Transcript_7420:39-467(+)|eukprot:CAMPEP_0119331124 /NCGR_PEP_ID=MMETSP1333-20130426/79864_1 /TAXON_ID=418940 /ORGANISM="Scyphosphaera apsteinii, Strain RCC1455" /LENGTH=142 /DNA_ID=CAMNT_0007340651 /DNA_START=38 /DNA_END=466 /DNA_ORIENTATION=-
MNDVIISQPSGGLSDDLRALPQPLSTSTLLLGFCLKAIAVAFLGVLFMLGLQFWRCQKRRPLLQGAVSSSADTKLHASPRATSGSPVLRRHTAEEVLEKASTHSSEGVARKFLEGGDESWRGMALGLPQQAAVTSSLDEFKT